MIFLSDLLRETVFDRAHVRVGTLQDICVSLHETFPVITALIVRHSQGGLTIIPWFQVRSIEEHPLLLTVTKDEIIPYSPRENELLLKRDLLDKQIVDTQGFRVVKANDLKLVQIKRTARLIGVDISFSGLMRRLGLLPIATAVGHMLPVSPGERTITWNYVEPIEMVAAGMTGQLALAGAGTVASVGAPGTISRLQLNVSHRGLAELRPADIADILEQLDVEEAGAMLERLDTETAADTLNEVEYPRQTELLSGLNPERASDLLERLAPDDAADILADLPQDEAEHLLNLMPIAESQPIRDLLRYGAQTAGGIMTNEVLALSQQATVEDALAYIRQNSAHLEMLNYLYIVDSLADEERHLVGVVSLRQLVIATPNTRLQDLMNRDVIRVQLDTDQEEVARVIAKYDLLAVPVVDAENRLHGMITVDDVIDVIHEEHTEDYSEMAGASIEGARDEGGFSLHTALSRFSWQALNAVVGFLLALLIARLFSSLLFPSSALTMLALSSGSAARLSPGPANPTLGSLLCLVPMLLLTSGSIGSQALGIAGWELRSKRGRAFLKLLGRELLHGTIGGILTSILVALLSLLLFRSLPLSIAVGLATGLTLFVAALCGMVLPNALQRLRLRGSWLSAPLLDPVIAAISLCVFLPLTLTLLSKAWL